MSNNMSDVTHRKFDEQGQGESPANDTVVTEVPEDSDPREAMAKAIKRNVGVATTPKVKMEPAKESDLPEAIPVSSPMLNSAGPADKAPQEYVDKYNKEHPEGSTLDASKLGDLINPAYTPVNVNLPPITDDGVHYDQQSVSQSAEPEQAQAYVGSGIIDPATMEAAMGGEIKSTEINVAKEVEAREQMIHDNAEKEDLDEMTRAFGGAFAAEDERMERLEAVEKLAEMGDPELKKVMDDSAAAVSKGGVNGSSVQTVDNAVANPIENYRARRMVTRSNDPEMDPYDLMPDYSEDDKSKPEGADVTPKADDEEPEPTNAEELNKYLRELPAVDLEASAGEEPLSRVRTVRNDRAAKAVTGLGDQAFMNAVSRYKRDNCAKVSVPLVNSGFMCDVVGTGVVDLENLYAMADQNISREDYQLEQMRTVIRNVVGTTPWVNPAQLGTNIHYADFDMLAFAHVCGTIETVHSAYTCIHCAKPFRIQIKNPTDMLLNGDELMEKKKRIQGASSIDQVSLMSFNREFVTEDGFKVVLSHPSYAEVVSFLRSLDDIVPKLSSVNRVRFGSMLQDTLYFIRSIRMPNGVTSSNLFQHYMALTMMAPESLDFVQKEAEKLRKDIVHPKFGIRRVRCPHCNRDNTDISFGSLYDLVFYHTTVSRALAESTPQSSND